VAGVVGAEVEFHPVKLVNAITGFFFIDFLREDLGHTRGLDLATNEREAMEDLIGTLSPQEMRARMEGRMIAPPPPPLSPPPNSPEPPKPVEPPTPAPAPK
jgi:hypothetical protein